MARGLIAKQKHDAEARTFKNVPASAKNATVSRATRLQNRKQSSIIEGTFVFKRSEIKQLSAGGFLIVMLTLVGAHLHRCHR